MQVRSPEFSASADASVLTALYVDLLSDELAETATAEATQAGIEAQVEADYRGLTISLGGYNDRLPQLATMLTSMVRHCPLERRPFGRRRAALLSDLTNALQRPPHELCAYYRGLALDRPQFTVEELHAAASRAQFSDMQAFQRRLLPLAELDALVCGNVREDEARAMARQLQRAVASAPLPAMDSPHRKVVQLPVGARTRQHVAPRSRDDDLGALEIYFQIGQETGGGEWRLLGLLDQLVRQPFYSELRTRQQLGYIVESGVADSGEGVRGLFFLVQSSALPPPKLEQKVDAFLKRFRATLAAMPDAEFADAVGARAARVGDADKRLELQAKRFWSEIAARRFDFERPWRESAAARKLTKRQLLDFFDARIATGGSLRCRLSTHVFSYTTAPRGQLTRDSLGDATGADISYFPTPTPSYAYMPTQGS